ncbi:MAG: hypothetical protein FJ049_00670 [Cyanobacteria bacterium M_surface_7_m2_037]|jgi:hypothetical protein|nr:hypothetical protein [Cyanobacteria bacterium K_DeepCast_0m_m1_088]MBM5794631.1 hypothetical protein [Cyanobacteria bacterium M_surface_7_m2_037]MBM5818604.1 hypothetical protein [Cyanobacteria bacterium K_DeepCast_150m_m2_101]
MSLNGSLLNASTRVTRRRSSAGPIPPNRPLRPRDTYPSRSSVRPTFLTLRDHGKVFVADLPRLSDGQLAHVGKEAREVLESISRRLEELDQQLQLSPPEQETRIRAATKRDVTERFIRAVEEEQEQRRTNPALKAAAGESLARAFLEIARHRLPGATFDSLLQEALAACDEGTAAPEAPAAPAVLEAPRPRLVSLSRPAESSEAPERERMPVVLTPDPSPLMGQA